MIILDTNVISEAVKLAPEPNVMAQLDRWPRRELWLTALTFYELRLGLELMAEGARRRDLDARLSRYLDLGLGGRILPFDERAARRTAALHAHRGRQGRRVAVVDTMIAGIALAHGATIATRNVRDFADLDVPVVDPWAA